uniref:Ribosome-binding factor A n=1 Tax=Plectus sambesii TaxID=2011161 RepID=A0A914XJB5_9BILA
MSSSSLTTGRRCLSLAATCLKSFGKTGRGRGGTNIGERDLRRLAVKRERTFVALMHKKFGIETGNDDVLLTLEAGFSGPKRLLDPKKREQLSVIFGEKIAEALQEEPALSGFRIDISKVDVARDMHNIKVYWVVRSDVVDDRIENALSDAAPGIRAKLTAQQIFTTIPAIKFVRDLSSLRVEEMDRIFASADYGMDYRAVSQSAATLGSVSNATQSAVVPPWVQRFKERQRRKANNDEDNSDKNQSKND